MTRLLLYSTIYLAGILFLLTGCDSDRFDCVRGNGVLTNEQTELDEPFVAVYSQGSFEIFITPGESGTVRIEAEENIHSKINVEVENNTLIIGSKNGHCINESKSVKIYVTTKSLEAINNSGSGRMEASGFESDHFNAKMSGSGEIELELVVDELKADLHGSGEMTLEGTTRKSNIEVSGSGSVKAGDLIQQICFIDMYGSGEAFVNVAQLLDVEVSGSGKVYYRGGASVESRISGSGSVIRY